MRVGIGYDVHSLVPGRKLVLGGVDIPFDKGLGGWSDADVLAHAIMDALLGAAALGDIGTHFPPGDPQYKGISSMVLLNRVRHMLIEKGWEVENIDSVVVAEKPKIKDFVNKMRRKLSESLGIDMERVSIKATTSEKMGFAGRGEGIAAYAVALIKSASE
ncbi:MAG: 2-C-methyl-D-erythritol 2,4-cyclodiphosphate synthase [Chloroflexi bacterium]|nr:2-C-methyl-D-erythritol 2,4-cyclodiphosphate synthase [Chloroflexota bacterium]